MKLCEICSLPVTTEGSDWSEQVTVWVSGPKKDGAKLRESTGKFAHTDCIEKVAKGVAPDQTELEI